jgi:thioredoxin-disulfide reductase
MDTIYDVIILGAGPAGLTAAIYAKRAELEVLVIEKGYVSGGQMLNTYEVDNYPGFKGIGGFDLGIKFKEHADSFSANFVQDDIISAEFNGKIKIIKGKKAVYKAKTVILAMGASHKQLDIVGEKELLGKGISYCATCDGAFFKEKVTAVVGGGDVALEDAIYLSRICKKVYLIHRRNEFRAAKTLQTIVKNTDNIEIVTDTIINEIKGEDVVESLLLENKLTKNKFELEVAALFVAVGIIPQTNLEGDIPNVDEGGYIIANEDTVTSIEGVFAAGDLRTKFLRQIVTAVSDGANAVSAVERYLSSLE